jgi:maltooligosyltrehalose trehalohydrolase
MIADNDYQRRWPVGAEIVPGQGVHFRLWANRRKKVSLSIVEEGGAIREAQEIRLAAEGDGYFSTLVPSAGEGTRYFYRLDNESKLLPDPASRFQPLGVHGPSQTVACSRFTWRDQEWPGIDLQGQVIYEMHIGTFTPQGTWQAAAAWLPKLAETGISVLEIMPVGEFAGEFGWGYDGVFPFAPTHLYGEPDDMRFFVDQAHALGLGVILDVIYNHFGPVGNYFAEYSLDYFTDRYETEWGYALNFDGKNSLPVREFIISNAAYWISEFHIDGLRLDATQSIFDRSPVHVVTALVQAARQAAGNRQVVVTGENEPQQTMLLQGVADGGFGLDGLWNDDFHHSAMVALSGRSEAYYTDYRGSPQEFLSLAKWGFLYQGQYYNWQDQSRGSPTFGLAPYKFINFLQNHDQIANSARGQRCHELTTPGRLRAATAFLLLIPGTPLLFQGQEFGASSPFTYFADHEPELAELVKKGRIDFLRQFKSLDQPDVLARIGDPADPRSFIQCKLDHSERSAHSEILALHQDLLRLRREDEVFQQQRTEWLHGAVIGPEAFILRWIAPEAGDRLLIVNLGRQLILRPISEPLLAPPQDSHWELFWSSEAAKYGGDGLPPLNLENNWEIAGHAAVVLAPKKVVRLRYG